MIAQVIPEIRTRGREEIFSYLVPEELQSKIQVGLIVNIPFGSRTIRGVVAEISKSKIQISNKSQNPKSKYQLKGIKSLNSSFIIPDSYIKIAKWIAEYYLCSLGEAIELFLPPNIKNPREAKSYKLKAKSLNLKKLNTEQEKIFYALKQKLNIKKKKPALIFGVTGSGKTEVYIKLAKEAIKLGKQVIVLVPEIVLTPQTVERFEEVFNQEVCLMHSGLSQSEKFNCYDQFYNGKKSIIVGPRSALLIPTKKLGLIIVDEEQEESYKQEQNPRYNAVDLAEVVAEKTNALLVLGTATPRIETFYKAKEGIFDLFEIKSRYQKLILPPAEVVDLKQEIQSGNLSPISEKLSLEITRVLKNKKQVLLFLNRRGASTYVSCRDCGDVINCPNCGIPLIYHIGDNTGLRCHHCDFKTQVPKKCPNCQSFRIKYFGAGVEKIEQEIIKLFPKARVVRIDAEILDRKDKYEKFYQDFKNHKFDIVIGTQILAKGLDIPGIDLVGVISADVGLHMPYFRASEKTFRIITQVSGRSGRTHNVGKTIIQTYWPNSRAIRSASQHDYEQFYQEEIEHRKELGYPPFSHIIRVVSEHENQKTAQENIEKLSNDLEKLNLDFIGPGLCFFARLRGRWRYHIIIKLKFKDQRLKLRNVYLNHPALVWDVDAYDML